MKTILISILGFFLIIQCYSSPINPLVRNIHKNIRTLADFTKNGTTKDQIAEDITPKFANDFQHTIFSHQNGTNKLLERTNLTSKDILENKDVIIIDLEKVNKMSPVEYVGRQLRSLWHYLLYGNKQEEKSSFVGRCAKIAKKLGQLIPMVMVGGAVIIIKLAFLILFSLKTLGLLGLLLLLNVGTIAAKLGALWGGSKKSGQNLHFHVDKSDDHEHSFSSSHLHGPPYGWDDRTDKNLEGHELYNLYEKLKLENDFKKLLSSVRRDNYYQ